MRELNIKYIINILFLIVLQASLFNYAGLSIKHWTFIPYVYLLGIMLLPFETREEQVLIISFVTGLIVDIISGTLALHTAATVFVGYFRNLIFNWIAPRLGYEAGQLPSYLNLGILWFIKYTVLFTFFHHFALFLLDYFSIIMIPFALLKALINSVYSSIFIILLHYLLFPNRAVAV